ncbi:TetR/AcrR family transcriptional regulator [Streptomyces sp. NBC_01304]|uniref:TetR/AcrR family transcriptional regulator n=1 Tax=Streptomyces sp. NBC_01304 TaxID=2903818 RepID=UPI002E14E09F|nr:TetR/AcrR family transcriptional regulator [Streptomyces sp. NBC_01304]
MPPTPRDRPLRADARRNLELLLGAAREVIAEQGPDAPMDEVARRAGVGNATLYRRFPTRRALLEAVHQERIEALHTRAQELLSAGSPGQGLELWLRELVRHGSSSRGLTATLTAALRAEPGGAPSRCGELVDGAAAALLQRAQAAGEIDDGVTTGQVLKLVNAIAFATEQDGEPGRQADQLLSLLMNGLRRHTS